MSVPSVNYTPPTTDTTPVSHIPLTKEEKAQLATEFMSSFALTEEQANELVEKLTPEQAHTYLNLTSGKTNITREQAQKMWGLSNEEADAMFGHQNKIGVFDNPFGDLFLRFLMLSYALGLDMKKMMSGVANMKFDEAMQAAHDRKEGAHKEFACSMAAAALFIGFGAGSLVALKFTKADKMNPHNPLLQWLNPMTASQLGAPLTAMGGYLKAEKDYDASTHDANNQLLETIYQQLMNTWQSTNDAGRTYSSGL